MKYQKGRFYNDNHRYPNKNECLQIVNPSEQHVIIKKKGKVVKDDYFMISKDGAIMTNAERPFWNSATFNNDNPNTDKILDKGQACKHALFVGKNEGGVEVIVKNNSYEKLPDNFSDIDKSDYVNRPSAYQHAMQVRRTVYAKSVEKKENDQFETNRHL